MIELFNLIVYQPLFNLLVGVYNVLPGGDFGVAIIVFTVLVRLVFVPLSLKTIRSQKELAQLQPKIKEIQEKHKDDRQAMSQAMMALYKEHKVNPFGGCLPLIIQIIVLLGLYQALQRGLDPQNLKDLYSFVENPGAIREIAFGFLNLTQKSHFLAVLAGVFQLGQSFLTLRNQPPAPAAEAGGSMASAMNKQMLYFFPFMIIIISWNLPAGIVLYWAVTTLFSAAEQAVIRYRS